MQQTSAAPVKPLKIGFVIDDSLDKPDGVQQYVLTLGEWLRNNGQDVHYLTSTTQRHDIANIHSLSRNIPVRFNGNRLSIPLPANRRKINKLLASEQFDVLHVQLPHSPLLAGRIITAVSPATAVVGTFHILPLDRITTVANRMLALALKRSLRRFDFIASVSAAARTFALRTYGISSAVLPNTIDYQRFAYDKPAATNNVKPVKIVTIAYLGRLVPRKGCQILLTAIFELRQRCPDLAFNVVIGGRGPLEASLKSYVTTHRLDDSVRFDGFITEADKPAFLQKADIAVFPSRGGESFGIVLLEAMAAGAAVLAGDNPGYASVMSQYPEQLFDASSDKCAAKLSKKIESLIIDGTKRRQWQTQGKAFASGFDASVVGQAWLTEYYQALQALRKHRT